MIFRILAKGYLDDSLEILERDLGHSEWAHPIDLAEVMTHWKTEICIRARTFRQTISATPSTPGPVAGASRSAIG